MFLPFQIAVLTLPETLWSSVSYAVSALVAGIPAYYLGRARNKKLLAEADNLQQNTNNLLIKTTRDLLSLKDTEIDAYKNQFRSQANRQSAVIDELNVKIGLLEEHVNELRHTVDHLRLENARLTALLTKRLRTLFLSTDEGSVQLIISPEDADSSESDETI
jgi:septal ring factor EnvC (AmiA/AmiB activator)